jgi:LysM repeat protein
MRALVPFVSVACLAGFGILFIMSASGALVIPGIELPGQEPTETPTPSRTPTRTPTLPPTITPLPTPLPPIRYTIKPGDTTLAIAIEYDVAPWAINELNNLAPDAVLSVGQVLLIPIPTATPRASPPPTETPMP